MLVTVVIVVAGHVIAVMRAVSVFFLRAKLILHSSDGRFLRAKLTLCCYCYCYYYYCYYYLLPTTYNYYYDYHVFFVE